MRTNVNLADDARQITEEYARANGISLGEAITELIRDAKDADVGKNETHEFGRSDSGFPIFPPSGRIISTEMVIEALHEDLI